MAEKSLEERMQQLEETYGKRIQRLEDIHQIHNLMGRYIWKHNVFLDNEFPETIYAKKAKGVSSEVANGGRWEDDDFRNKYKGNSPNEFPPGNMIMHHLDTPVIEVAGDGKTAKGVWLSPGHETYANAETGECQANWCWCKYGLDFVKEDGEWKIWHYHSYRIFKTPFNIPWTDEFELKGGYPPPVGIDLKKRIPPTRPTTYDNPYSTTTLIELVPTPPEPYETWDDNTPSY